MDAEQLWTEFCTNRGIDIDTPYDAWGFDGDGDTPDELARLVLKKKKFGTASLYDSYVFEDELDELPKIGEYSIILDSNDEALCVIRMYDVYIRPFDEVSPFHAYSEGEGDCSLEYWRSVRKDFFTEELEGTGIELTENSKVVCEKFSVEYIPGQKDDDDLMFIEPTMLYADEIAAYKQEMIEADSSFDGCFSLKRMPSVKEFVDSCITWSNPSREPDEHGAWGNVLLCIRRSDNKMVGCMQVHNVLTERMKNYTGHVGYSVRPSERRKGYAKKMLAKAADFLKSFGFDEIIVSCIPDNEASKKTILANGGEYLETVFLDSDGVYLDKYRILLNK